MQCRENVNVWPVVVRSFVISSHPLIGESEPLLRSFAQLDVADPFGFEYFRCCETPLGAWVGIKDRINDIAATGLEKICQCWLDQ